MEQERIVKLNHLLLGTGLLASVAFSVPAKVNGLDVDLVNPTKASGFVSGTLGKAISIKVGSRTFNFAAGKPFSYWENNGMIASGTLAEEVAVAVPVAPGAKLAKDSVVRFGTETMGNVTKSVVSSGTLAGVTEATLAGTVAKLSGAVDLSDSGVRGGALAEAATFSFPAAKFSVTFAAGSRVKFLPNTLLSIIAAGAPQAGTLDGKPVKVAEILTDINSKTKVLYVSRIVPGEETVVGNGLKIKAKGSINLDSNGVINDKTSR